MIYNCAEEFSPLYPRIGSSRSVLLLTGVMKMRDRKISSGWTSVKGTRISFPKKLAERALRIIRAWRCESTRCREAGQADQNQQKSAYLHKLAWQWIKIVDEDCTFFRITFHRSTVADAPVSATTEEKEEKPLRLRCHRRGGT